MLSGLMGVSLESFVLDNELCGSILSSMRSIDVPVLTDDLESIRQVIERDKHFLGESDTLKRMSTDFDYPKSAKRLSPELWMKEKDNIMLNEARKTLEKEFATSVMSAVKKIISKDVSDNEHKEVVQKSLDDFRK